MQHASSLYCLQETHLSFKDQNHLKEKGWKNYSKQRDQEASRHYLNVFQLQLIRKDRDRYFIQIKRYINQENIKITNICAPKSGTPSFIKSILMKLKTQMNIKPIILDILNIRLSKRQIIWTNNKQRNLKVKWHIMSNGPDRYLQTKIKCFHDKSPR